MSKRSPASTLRKAWHQGLRTVTSQVMRAAKDVARETVPGLQKTPPHPSPGLGEWIAGLASGRAGMRRYRLFRPQGLSAGERVPLLVMLHGCGQDAAGLARSARMNRVAAREGFLVLYPEQSRVANPQRCWNWFDTESGRAQAEAALILAAIDQVALIYPADRERVAVAGLSAGAGMAALLATTYPARFRAVAMHSGVPPGLAGTANAALRAMRGKAPAAKVEGGTDWPPLLVIQGSKDRVVAPANAFEAVRQWALAAGAPSVRSRTVQRGKRLPMQVVDFQRGKTVAATLVEIDGLAHAWSGGAAKEAFSDPTGPDASAMIWRFVAKHL